MLYAFPQLFYTLSDIKPVSEGTQIKDSKAQQLSVCNPVIDMVVLEIIGFYLFGGIIS